MQCCAPSAKSFLVSSPGTTFSPLKLRTYRQGTYPSLYFFESSLFFLDSKGSASHGASSGNVLRNCASLLSPWMTITSSLFFVGVQLRVDGLQLRSQVGAPGSPSCTK